MLEYMLLEQHTLKYAAALKYLVNVLDTFLGALCLYQYICMLCCSEIFILYMSVIHPEKTYCTHTCTHLCRHAHVHTHVESASPVKNTLLQASVFLLKCLLLAYCIRKGSHLCGLSTSRPMTTKTSNEDVIVFRNHVLYFHIYNT